jgi:hypothetical protein
MNENYVGATEAKDADGDTVRISVDPQLMLCDFASFSNQRLREALLVMMKASAAPFEGNKAVEIANRGIVPKELEFVVERPTGGRVVACYNGFLDWDADPLSVNTRSEGLTIDRVLLACQMELARIGLDNRKASRAYGMIGKARGVLHDSLNPEFPPDAAVAAALPTAHKA